ncbi:MAG TPA: RsmE family RNA methyltransferase, partial [Herpetosiphonaceae bacterium]|nr:RsmE family RNA methyltransferase [Herpetosiphonaceae bacterium]
LPKLLPPQPFAAACEHAGRSGEALLLWEGGGVLGLRATLQRIATPSPDRDPLSLAILSGPEGGWSEAEINTTTMYNISLVSLGPRTLRAETAPIAAAAAVFFQFGEME